MTVYINSKIKIDRIKFGCLGISFKLFTHFKGLAQDFQNITPLFDYKNISTQIKKYRASITYKIAQKQNVLRLEAGSSKNKQCYIIWEFWPKNIQQSKLAYFLEIIKLLMDNEHFFIYKNVFEKGKITYIELACDLITPPINDLIFWKPKTRKGSIYRDNNSIKGAIYVGSATSSLQFCIYDKAKQLKDTGQNSLLDKFTRIEARLRKKT